jgi:hypothetical protein
VDHSRSEYAYAERKTGVVVTTSSAESYFSVFKRGMTAFISTARKSICIAIWPSLISVIRTGLNSKSTIRCEPRRRCKASRASVLPIEQLVREKSPNRRTWEKL